MKKNSLLTILGMALVATASVIGTLAYLTDSDSVVNTFTVGKVDIILDETSVDENGDPILDEEGNPVDRVKENEYHLIPGHTYVKDPTITIQEKSEPAYVRMILTVHSAEEVQNIIDKYELGDFSTFIGGWDEEVWLYEDYVLDTEADTISFEFRYKDIIGAEEEPVVLPFLFETLTIPGIVSGEELETLYKEEFQMVVYGHAIQAAGFEDEDSAWEAFDDQVEIPAKTETENETKTESETETTTISPEESL